MTILILHGITGKAGIHWQQWLHDELVKLGHTVIMPTLPSPDHPDRIEWLETVKKLIEGVNPSQLIIVGHSLGVVAALDYIEQTSRPVLSLISIAGFGEDYGAELNSYFMKVKQLNYEKIRENAQYFEVFYGNDDPYVPQSVLESLAEKLQVEPRIFPQGGHLNTSTGFTTFPDLLSTIQQFARTSRVSYGVIGQSKNQ
ncbi:serine hydrolase family protein [Candidatus Roizmanbacteria bacterium]|nr:serine hydrolase family protein [Candidatus Roizmanbacteria bacterium]